MRNFPVGTVKLDIEAGEKNEHLSCIFQVHGLKARGFGVIALSLNRGCLGPKEPAV